MLFVSYWILHVFRCVVSGIRCNVLGDVPQYFDKGDLWNHTPILCLFRDMVGLYRLCCRILSSQIARNLCAWHYFRYFLKPYFDTLSVRGAGQWSWGSGSRGGCGWPAGSGSAARIAASPPPWLCPRAARPGVWGTAPPTAGGWTDDQTSWAPASAWPSRRAGCWMWRGAACWPPACNWAGWRGPGAPSGAGGGCAGRSPSAPASRTARWLGTWCRDYNDRSPRQKSHTAGTTHSIRWDCEAAYVWAANCYPGGQDVKLPMYELLIAIYCVSC